MSEWVQLQSSNIARIRYDASTLTLEVEFHNGRMYQYFDVPMAVFQGLRTAQSPGGYLANNIKGHFRYARV